MELRKLKLFRAILLPVFLMEISSTFCLECNGSKSITEFNCALSINETMLSDLKSFFNRTELEAVLEDDGYKLAWDTGIDSYLQISNSSHPFQKQFAIVQLESILKQMQKLWPEVQIELPLPLDDLWTWDTRTRNGFFIDHRTTDERFFENKTYQYVTKEVSIRMHLTPDDLQPFEKPTSDALNKAGTFFKRKYLMALYSPNYRVICWIGKDGSFRTVRERSHRLLKSFATIVLREMLEQLDTCEEIRHKFSKIFENFWDLSNDVGSYFLFRQFRNQTWDLKESSNIFDL